MDLVIVESPTKARKLKGYLGKDYAVEASVGHVRDLPKSSLGVDIEKNFEPEYVVASDKKKVVTGLKKLAKGAQNVVLAMDPDREGEAIAWHVKHLLEGGKGASPKFLRATFNQITKQAVLDALKHPGEISQDLVDAQQARRVMDRLVGYKVSPVLWKKVRRGLSAGRVQSVALRLIVEREREIEAFKPDEYWEIDVALDVKDQKARTIFVDGKAPKEVEEGVILAQVTKVSQKKYQPTTEGDVTPVVADLKKAEYRVLKIEQKERSRSSLPPFTTSTLQQAAATRFGFSARQTMAVAQQLYEEGLITYHRTDSVNLAKEAIGMARDVIKAQYGSEYVSEKPRVFATRSKNAQEAHEAIRVTDVNVTKDEIPAKGARLEGRHAKLYDLIWRRFVASQMKKAVYLQTKMTLEADKPGFETGKARYQLQANGSVKKFAGWTVLFANNNDTLLPAVKEQQPLYFADINPQQKFTQPPPRYNDASLVKELEKRGIGRPSTYASIISVIVSRGYVDRQEKRFWATTIGKVVSDFLMQHFVNIMDYDFTAEMEEDLDRISRGEKEWRQVVGTFFTPLAKKIKDVEKNADRATIPVEKTGEKCPDCGDSKEKSERGEIVIRTGRYGKFKSCSRYPDCKFTENIVETLDDRKCPLCDKGDIVIKPSRWGKSFYGCGDYPNCDWASWKKPEPGLTLTKEEWAEMQKAREERKKARAKGKKSKGARKKKTTKKAKAKK